MKECFVKPQQAGGESMKKSQPYIGAVFPTRQYASQEEYILCGKNPINPYMPMQAVPCINNGSVQWVVSKRKEISLTAFRKTGILMMREGDHFIESEQGILQKLKSGEQQKVANIRFKIIKIVDSYYDEGKIERRIHCSVACQKWAEPRELIVSKDKYLEFFDIARRKYPEIIVMPNSKGCVTEYLAEVYAEAEKKCQIEIEIASRGWFELEGQVIFAIGTDPIYKTAPIPDIKNLDRFEQQEIYRKGIDFLKVGKQGSEISVSFLFAHLGFSSYWLERGGLPCRFCLYLNGPSGSLKTSTANVLANVFETDLSKKNIRFTASDASIKNILSSMKDTTILVDDFSASENETKRHSTTIMENIIRIVGDGVFPSKMGLGYTVQRKLRAAVMMTGEDEPGLAESSVLRCVNLSIQKGTFSGKILTDYQCNDFLKLYFSLYIKFLEKYGAAANSVIEDCIFDFRQSDIYENMAPRLRDAAIVFEVQIALLREFARWIDIPEVEYDLSSKILQEGMRQIIMQNDGSQKVLPIERMFLEALFQSMGAYSGTGIAESETIYYEAECGFLGFEEKETGQLWIDFDKAYKLIKEYWRGQGIQFLKSPKKIKECLAATECIVCRKNELTGTEYLIKSKKGRRKRMLVLIKSVVENMLDDIKI